MLLCGLMPEEVVALQWKDIVFDEKESAFIVDVNKSGFLSSSPAVIREGKLKTDFRSRKINIVQPLTNWIAENYKDADPESFIFTMSNGEVMSKSSLRSRFQTYLKDLDRAVYHKKPLTSPKRTAFDKELTIKSFTMYDLRHTYATLLVELEVPVRKATALMGHATSTTTERYYVDWGKISTSDYSKKLGEFLETL